MGAPVPHRGPYDVEPIREWLENNTTRTPAAKAAQGKDSQSLTTRKLAAEVRIKEAQADQEEAKRDKIRGSLITVAEAKREITSLMGQVKTYMLSIPRASADEILHLDSQAEAEAILTRLITDQLEAVSGTGTG